MKTRVILSSTLLLLAAAPTFALPLCEDCNYSNYCEPIPGSIERCSDGWDFCYTTPERCSPPLQATVMNELKVVSLEISRPSLESITVTAPAQRAEVRTPEPVAKK